MGSGRVFGQSTPALLANYDQDTSSWRTSQLSLLEEWDEFSETWPRSGMTRSGIAFRLVPLAPLTGGIGSGLLPTPKAWPTPKASPESALTKDGLWTTPCADDTGHRKGKYAQGGTALSAQAGGQLNPTWVEWLMGFPTGWTDLEASATP